jgi:PadR family transcriptional regulator, regulatory protein AphA
MELSPTAYVILGTLGWRPMSGYEIKSIVDKSTRFFWAASYGQIYPELRRLAAAGLIEGKASPQGGRRRNVYRLTPAGRKELRAWLDADPEVFELRDEALLKLFFADATGGDSATGTLAAKRRTHERIVERLKEIEATGKPEGFAYLVLRYGIELNEWTADWCERAGHALEDDAAERRTA